MSTMTDQECRYTSGGFQALSACFCSWWGFLRGCTCHSSSPATRRTQELHLGKPTCVHATASCGRLPGGRQVRGHWRGGCDMSAQLLTCRYPSCHSLEMAVELCKLPFRLGRIRTNILDPVMCFSSSPVCQSLLHHTHLTVSSINAGRCTVSVAAGTIPWNGLEI